MFNCSANVCSSATDFCFNSAISTGGTPCGLARRRVGLGGWVVRVQDRTRLDRVCGGAGRRSLLDVVGRGVSCQTRKLPKVETQGGGVKWVFDQQAPAMPMSDSLNDARHAAVVYCITFCRPLSF